MDESTTTAAPTDDGAGAPAQPVEQVETQAAENQPNVSQDTNQDAQAAPTDENLAWLQNKGVDPNSPEALAKVAEMYRNAEKQMHESTAQKAQLQNALQQPPQGTQADDYAANPVAALTAEVQALKTTQTVNSFFESNPDAKQYEAQMSQMVIDNPNLGELVKGGYFSVEQLYHMARGSDTSRDTTLKTEGAREALQTVADKQQAKAVVGKATSSSMGASGPTKDNVNEWYAGLSAAERAKPETQNIVASLLS